jgi:hypothetical protein
MRADRGKEPLAAIFMKFFRSAITYSGARNVRPFTTGVAVLFELNPLE